MNISEFDSYLNKIGKFYKYKIIIKCTIQNF